MNLFAALSPILRADGDSENGIEKGKLCDGKKSKSVMLEHKQHDEFVFFIDKVPVRYLNAYQTPFRGVSDKPLLLQILSAIERHFFI